MASGFFSRLANLSEAIPDDEEAPSIFSTGIFGFGQAAATTAPVAGGAPHEPGEDRGLSSARTAAAAGPSPSPRGGPSGPPSVNSTGAAAAYGIWTANAGVPSTASGSHPSSSSAAAAGEEVRMLQRRVADLTKKLAEKTQQYKDLMDEATSVKAEFDAYRRKSEAKLRQERQLAQEDKRRLEELRQASGGAGNVDEVYVKGLKGKVHEMELKLRDAAAETQKAVKRQREAEETRKRVEKEKKDEIAELVARYEQLLERAQQRQEQLEAQLAEDRAWWAAAQREDDAGDEDVGGEGGMKEQAEAAGSKDAAAAATGEEAAEREAPSVVPEASARTPAPPPDAAHDAETGPFIAQLQRQVAQLRGRVKELEHQAALQEERGRRQLDEAASDALESQKRLTKKSTELDELKARYTELQSAMATKDDEHASKERDTLYQLRQLEDAVARGKRERQELQQEAERRRQEYEAALQSEKERAVLTSQRVSEAESASKEVASTPEAQRDHFTAMLDTRDATIAELNAIRRGLEQDVADLREDARQQADRLEQLQREQAQQALLVKDLEAKQMHRQRLLSLREEELQAREGERQRLRALLREEEDSHAQTRQELTEATIRIAEGEGAVRELEEALLAAQQESSGRDAYIHARVARCDELEQALAEKEAVLGPLKERAATLQTANVQLREELSGAMRRLDSLQQRLARAPHSLGGGATAEGDGVSRPFGGAASRHAVLAHMAGEATSAKPSAHGLEETGAHKYTLPPSSRERHMFVQEAWQSARRLSVQARSQRLRIVFGAVAVLVVGFMILSGLLTASSATARDVLRDVERRCAAAENGLQLCWKDNEELRKRFVLR